MLTRCGDDLFSIDAASPWEAHALALRLREAGEWLDVVAGIDTVMLRFDAALQDAHDASRVIRSAIAADLETLERPGTRIEIPVVYGGDFGPDLDELAEVTGMSVAALIEKHTSRDYEVEMVGFTPGFAFIGGLDECFRMPRRKEPRQRVAAGSVGIADGRTGLYAMASPGGWNIIGRTPCKLFDAAATEPFALSVGMRVRFKAIDADEFEP